MALNVRTFPSAFGALLNAATTMDHSGGGIALPLLGAYHCAHIYLWFLA